MPVLVIAVLAGCGHDKTEQAIGAGGVDASHHSGGASGTGGARAGGTDGSAGAAGSAGSAGTAIADAGADTVNTSDASDAAPADAGDESGAAAPTCDGVLPACVSPIASYARDIAPILAAKCNNCHSPEPGMPWPLDTYKNVVAWAPDVAGSLASCTMPPTDGGTPSLTPAEHHAIANWLACEAPDN